MPVDAPSWFETAVACLGTFALLLRPNPKSRGVWTRRIDKADPERLEETGRVFRVLAAMPTWRGWRSIFVRW